MKKPLLSELTLREKIGQTALSRPTNEGMKNPEKYPYGGVWGLGNADMGGTDMADRESKQKTKLEKWLDFFENFNKNSRIPIIQASDCTTGIWSNFNQTLPLLDCVSLGSTGDENLAYEVGVLRGKLQRCVGGRWVWGPEIDLSNRNLAIMLGRQYSDDPDLLVKMAIADIKGNQSTGVASTAKHFPGSDGLEYRDPHVSESMIIKSFDEWKETQGAMFQKLFDAGVYAVMTAHMAFPAYDSTKLNGRFVPSTISKKVITDLLKNEMGFKGVVITDGIAMRSLLTMFDGDMAKLYIAAINAGNDVILDAGDDYFDIIEDAVKRGEVSEERINDACQRVLDLKEKCGLFDDDYSLVAEDLNEVNKQITEFNTKAAEKAISLVSNKNNLLPVKKEDIKRVTIIFSGHDEKVFDSLDIMRQEFEKRGAEVTMHRRLPENYWDHPNLMQQIADDTDLIIFVGYLMRYAPEGACGFFNEERSAFWYALGAGSEKTIGIGLGSPFMYFDYYAAFPTFINSYFYAEANQKATVAAIYGEIPFEGGEPFALVPKEFKKYYDMLGIDY